ncbi:helix-turn-helix domain-containing protein [Sporanaerobium hydrogeniformans]|uniref:helix-turn-helix domain-containing protein n=1 Tax=Sporanaerobium hydrogeniformans TaxID=3072179 RepID=UPI0015D4AD4E|nr:helix-turn-helix domain-containing protein [Sporanaerobium hydrogeniformans]
MTKKEEERLLNKINQIEKSIAKLQLAFENNKIEKAFYTVREVSEMLHRTPRAVYNMIERGELDTVKLGGIKIKGESLKEKLKGGVE